MTSVCGTVQSGEPVILFTNTSQYSDLYGHMARDLRARYGISSVLLHLGATMLPDPKVYDFRESDFSRLVNFEPHLRPRTKLELSDGSKLAVRALEVEQKLGVSINELIRTDRHAGRRFVIGGTYPMTRYAQAVDYDQAVDIVLRIVEATESLLDELAPICIVNAPADLCHSALREIAEYRGIPVRIPGASFANTHFQWKANRFHWPAGLSDAYQLELRRTWRDPLDGEGEQRVADVERTSYARRFMQRSVHPTTPLKQIYYDVRGTLGRQLKRKNQVYGGPLLRAAIGHRIRLWVAKRRALRQPSVLPSVPDGMPYVLYPLVVEPESTLQTECPMSDNQLGLIDWLSKTIPAGWRLVVKEHPGFTTVRPKGFMERIETYPNVLLAAAFESGEALASRAQIVAMISGSLGFQAALAGIPVITFSPAWAGRFLPHVRFADSYTSVRSAIMSFVSGGAGDVAERRRCARALKAALEVGAIALEDPGILQERAAGKPVPEADVRRINTSLMESLKAAPKDCEVPFKGAEVWQRSSDIPKYLASFLGRSGQSASIEE